MSCYYIIGYVSNNFFMVKIIHITHLLNLLNMKREKNYTTEESIKCQALCHNFCIYFLIHFWISPIKIVLCIENGAQKI